MSERKTTGDPATWVLRYNGSGVPWISTENGKLTIVSSINGIVRPSGVAGAGPEARANAEFIIKACHKYEKLKEAVEFALQLSEAWRFDVAGDEVLKRGTSPDYDGACHSIELFREALGLPPEVRGVPESEPIKAPIAEDPAQLLLQTEEKKFARCVRCGRTIPVAEKPKAVEWLCSGCKESEHNDRLEHDRQGL